MAVWYQPGDSGRLDGNPQRAAGAFGPPQRLGDASHPRARLAVDARGDAIVVWVGAGGGLDIVQRPAGGAGASVVQRRLQLFSDELFPALDTRGDAAVAGWSSGSDVLAATRSAGGVWEPAVTLARSDVRDAALTDVPGVGIEAAGDGAVAFGYWYRSGGGPVPAPDLVASFASAR